MTKPLQAEELKKREKIQNHFWKEVGSVEHISLPKLKDAVKKEFNYKDDRYIQAQIELMQTEARIRIEGKVKVWINSPRAQTQRTGQLTYKIEIDRDNCIAYATCYTIDPARALF